MALPRLLYKPLFDNVKVASKQIKKHIEIGLMCSRQLLLLLLLLLLVDGCCRIAKDIALPVYFTGYNPKIKRGLSIKICGGCPRFAGVAHHRWLLFQDKTSCALEKHKKSARAVYWFILVG